MARILIAGCGYVGTKLANLLDKQGHDVWGLRRSAALERESFPVISADLFDPASLSKLPKDLDHLVYAVSAASRSESDYQLAYVEGIRNLMKAVAADQEKLPRTVYVSSTAVYGQSRGEWVDESSEAEPQLATAKILRSGEKLVRALSDKSIVLRLAGIYGPGRRRMIERVRAGGLSVDPMHPVYTNRIHRDDCAAVIAHIISLDKPQPIYVGVDCEPASQEEVYTFLADKLAAPNVELKELTNIERKAASQGKRCSNRLILESGYKFHFPSFRQGYLDMLNLPETAS